MSAASAAGPPRARAVSVVEVEAKSSLLAAHTRSIRIAVHTAAGAVVRRGTPAESGNLQIALLCYIFITDRIIENTVSVAASSSSR